MKIGRKWRQHTRYRQQHWPPVIQQQQQQQQGAARHTPSLSHPLHWTTFFSSFERAPPPEFFHHAKIPGVPALLGAFRIFDVQRGGGAEQKQQPEQLPAGGERCLPNPEQRLRRGQHERDVQGWWAFIETVQCVDHHQAECWWSRSSSDAGPSWHLHGCHFGALA